MMKERKSEEVRRDLNGGRRRSWMREAVPLLRTGVIDCGRLFSSNFLW
jgi:hypothetical protein